MKYTLQELVKLAASDDGKQQIRVIVALAVGWQIHPKDRFIVIPPNSSNSVQPLSSIPNYSGILDDMVGLIRGLNDPEFHKFCLNLSKLSWILYPDQTDQHSYMNRLRVSFAGAAIDHAIAFILTKQEVQP